MNIILAKIRLKNKIVDTEKQNFALKTDRKGVVCQFPKKLRIRGKIKPQRIQIV
jgi:hypothetical protein